METESEQMERFNNAVTDLFQIMRKQMHLNMDKGGWQDMDMWELAAGGRKKIGLAREASLSGDSAIARRFLADAANYIVMAFERLEADE